MTGEFADDEVTRERKGIDSLWGSYVIKAELGSGGMATVYLAKLQRATGFKNVVAIKRILSERRNDLNAQKAVLDEANIAAKIIERTHVCHVADVGIAHGSPFIVMEYLHGEPFKTVLNDALSGEGATGLPFWLSARIVADAAHGLHAAHTTRDDRGQPLGIVHRDVSPGNIFVTYDGVAKVVDFGVAKAAGRHQHTKTGTIKGKIPYMSPEHLTDGWEDEDGRRQPVDARTDVWALGVVLWSALVGKRLFGNPGMDDAQVMMRVMNAEIPKVRELRPDVPEELSYIVDAALQRRPHERYPTAGIMADELEAYLGKLPHGTGKAAVKTFMVERYAAQKAAKEDLIAGQNLEAAATILGARLVTGSEAMILNEESAEFAVTGDEVTRVGVFDTPTRAAGESVGFADAATALAHSGVHTGVRDGQSGVRSMSEDEVATVIGKRGATADSEITVEGIVAGLHAANRRRWWTTTLAAALLLGGVIAGSVFVSASGTDEPEELLPIAATPPDLQAQAAVAASAPAPPPEPPTSTEPVTEREESSAPPRRSRLRHASAGSTRPQSASRAPVEPPEVAPAEPEAVEGALIVLFEGRGWLYHQGRRVGAVPGRVMLPTGRQSIEVRMLNGRTVRQSVSVPGRVRVDLE